MLVRIALALAITLAVEVPIVAALYRSERLRMAICCALATGATNLAMNGPWLRMAGSYADYLLVGEIAALGIEAVAYVAVSREHEIGRALLASALANAASFGAGLVLLR